MFKLLEKPTMNLFKKIMFSTIMIIILACVCSCGNSNITDTQNNAPSSVLLVADKTQATADGIDEVTLTATVTDVSGTHLANTTVNFNISPDYYSYLGSEFTNKNGQVTILIKQIVTRNFFRRIVGPTTTTHIDVMASVNNISSNMLSLTYFPLSSAITTSVELVADKAQAIANGTDTVTFTATVKDVNGLAMPYTYLNFTVSPGANRFMSPGYTDANGIAVVRLKCPPNAQQTLTTINVTASSGGVTANTVSATYTNPPQVTPASVTLTSDKTSMLADGADRITFTITAYDSNSSIIAGQAYHLNVPAGPYAATTNILTNSFGQGLSALIYNHLAQPPLTTPTALSITATINGTTSNAILVTISPP